MEVKPSWSPREEDSTLRLWGQWCSGTTGRAGPEREEEAGRLKVEGELTGNSELTPGSGVPTRESVVSRSGKELGDKCFAEPRGHVRADPARTSSRRQEPSFSSILRPLTPQNPPWVPGVGLTSSATRGPLQTPTRAARLPPEDCMGTLSHVAPQTPEKGTSAWRTPRQQL